MAKKDNEVDIEKARQAGRTQRFERGASTIETCVRWFSVVAVFWFLYLCVRELAGRDTKFSAIVNAVASVGADRYVFLAVAVLCGGGYIREKKLRKAKENE